MTTSDARSQAIEIMARAICPSAWITLGSREDTSFYDFHRRTSLRQATAALDALHGSFYVNAVEPTQEACNLAWAGPSGNPRAAFKTMSSVGDLTRKEGEVT